jgi:7-cyano-7-deazaguanine synthase
MNNNYKNVLVLFSGGLDSTACTYYYLTQGYSVECLFIDYGQRASAKERESAANIASFLNVYLNCIKFASGRVFLQGEIKGRNAFLILAALLAYPHFRGQISIAIHYGTHYYDCSESFVKDINRVIDGYSDGQITLAVPFINWTKKMIYNYCKENNLPIDLTYSCESGTNVPCGKCLSCLDRRALNVS